jgi:hypothetical protein
MNYTIITESDFEISLAQIGGKHSESNPIYKYIEVLRACAESQIQPYIIPDNKCNKKWYSPESNFRYLPVIEIEYYFDGISIHFIKIGRIEHFILEYLDCASEIPA